MRFLIRPARRSHPRGSARGLTLVELMVAVAIAGLLLLAAAPHFADYNANSRLREGGITLQTEALIAQNEAIKRNRVVRLTTSGSTIQVLEAADPANPVVLRTRTLAGDVQMGSATVEFTSRGYPVDRSVSPSVEFVAASIDLSLAGMTCTSELRCPGLRVEAGGAIRLCGNRLSGCS